MKTLRRIAFQICVLLCGQPQQAGAYDNEVMENRSARFSSRIVIAPNSELPSKVQAAEGQLTLWADYSGKDADGIPLYLVNKTARDIDIPVQSGDPYIKLHRKSSNGSWQRAQAHLEDWCNFSFSSFKLRAHQHFRFHGYQPPSGTKQIIRFHCISDLPVTSNEGEGLVSDEDLRAVALDSVSSDEIPDSVQCLLWGMPVRDTYILSSLPEIADATRSLLLFRRNELMLKQLKELQTKIEAYPESDDKAVTLKTIRDVLAHQWTHDSNYASAIRVCVKRILDPSVPQPLISEGLAWSILGNLAESKGAPRFARGLWNAEEAAEIFQVEIFRPLIPKALDLLRTTNKGAVAEAAKQILASQWVVDTIVGDLEVDAWVKSESPSIREVGMFTMVRRFQFERLARLGMKLPDEVQLLVLSALVNGEDYRIGVSSGPGHSPWGDPEK